MGTNCCCGKLNCDQETVFFDVDRYINSEMKSFVEVEAKVHRSVNSWRPSQREPEKLIKEETFSFQDDTGKFYNLKGEDSYFFQKGSRRYIYRIEYTTKRKVALRFEIDDVYDWGKVNSFGHNFIDSIYFRPEAFDYSYDPSGDIFEFGEIIKSCSEDIEDLSEVDFSRIVPASFLPSSFEERSENLETDGIGVDIYKLAEDESMPNSVEEFDAVFGNGMFEYETTVIDKVFNGAEISEKIDDPDIDRVYTGFSTIDGIAKIEYREQDVNLRDDHEDQFEGGAFRSLKTFPYTAYNSMQVSAISSGSTANVNNDGYGKDVQIPYGKIDSNGSYVLLIDCPNVGTGDFICNQALIELRRISGADLYNAPQFFKETKTTFIPTDPENPMNGGEYKTERIEEQITLSGCESKVRSAAKEPPPKTQTFNRFMGGDSRLEAEYISFDLETTPRSEDTACNEILRPNFLLNSSNFEEWRTLYTRTEDGEYVSKKSFMDTRFDFDSFLSGPNYFVSGGKIELELFKPKTSNLKSGVAETYLQVLYELSYDRDLELVANYENFTNIHHIALMQQYNSPPTGRATAGDFGDVVNLDVIDPKVVGLPLVDIGPIGVDILPDEKLGSYATGLVSNSKSKLLTSPRDFVLNEGNGHSERTHWSYTFKPTSDQAKYIYRLKYRVLEGSSTFMGKDYIVREFLAASNRPSFGFDYPLAGLPHNQTSFGQYKSPDCFGDHSCWITDIDDQYCIRTSFPVFNTSSGLRQGTLQGVTCDPKKLVSSAVGGYVFNKSVMNVDKKYRPPILPVDRFGSISPGGGFSRNNYLTSLYIRGCAIESGSALVDVDSDLELFSPNEIHAYDAVPHYGKFSAAKFRFKLRQHEFYPLKLAREDINDSCPKECLAMEHNFEWKLLESDWDVGDRSKLSRADYGCVTILNHEREAAEWGGSFQFESCVDIVLATYIPEQQIVYAACFSTLPRYPAVENKYFDLPEDGVISIDRSIILCDAGRIGIPHIAVDYAGNNPLGHTTRIGSNSITIGPTNENPSIKVYEAVGVQDGYNSTWQIVTRKKTPENPLSVEKPLEETRRIFSMGSDTYHVDAGGLFSESQNRVLDIIGTSANSVENKYGENHQISLSEVSWSEAGDVFSEVDKSTGASYPYSFNIENHKDFIVGAAYGGLDLGYGRKASQIINAFLTEITSGESEYSMTVQGEDSSFLPFYSAGAGLRFRANASDGEDGCSGKFENDMLFYRRYFDDNTSPDRSNNLGFTKFDMSQATWAIQNKYATLLYQQYIPVVNMLLNKTKLNHPYVEQIVSLIKDTDVDKYWYKIGVDVTVPLDPEEEGHSFTSVVAPKDATVSKIYNKDNFVGQLVDAGDNLFEIITDVEEIKWDFFAGSITEIKVNNGDIVKAGDVVMIGEVGSTTREVVSEVSGRITLNITIGEELSKNQKLATVDIIENIVSPVKGQIEQLYVSEGEEAEEGQVLAGIVSTVTYEEGSYFYINQKGENIGPLESAQGFTFKKSTGEYEIRDGVKLFLDGGLYSSTYTSDRIERAGPNDPFFWYNGGENGYTVEGAVSAQNKDEWLGLVNTWDFGIATTCNQTTTPASSLFSDALIPRFTELTKIVSLIVDDTFADASLVTVDAEVLLNDASYFTQPFTNIVRTFDVDFESVEDKGGFDRDVNEFDIRPLIVQPSCDLCSEQSFEIARPACSSVTGHGRISGDPPQDIEVAEGDTAGPFAYHATYTTNDSDRFSGEYFLEDIARGSCGSVITYFGIVTETNQATPRLYYRKIVEKSKIDKCKKLPRLFFDYCNLLSGWELANNEASPVAHITTSLEYKPFRFGLDSRDILKGNSFDGWRNRHNSIFLSDKDISDIGSILDTIPESDNTYTSILTLVSKIEGLVYFNWPAGLDKARPTLMGNPPDGVQKDGYVSSFYADKNGGIFLENLRETIKTVVRFFEERFGFSLQFDTISNMLYEHLNGINGNAGYTTVTKENFRRAVSGSACGLYSQGLPIPPGGNFIPERSVLIEDVVSVLQASLGMDIYTLQRRYGKPSVPTLPKVGSFDFTENQNDKSFGYKSPFVITEGSEMPGFGTSDNYKKINENSEVLSFEPRGFSGSLGDASLFGPVRFPQLGYIKTIKTVPLNEYFFIIGDITDTY
jgi:biotin carboxyl carrier protein